MRRRLSSFPRSPVAAANTVSLLLLCLTLCRMALVVGATPIAAYANNYDFLRQSACTGIWLDYQDGRPKTAPNPSLAVDRLVHDGDVQPDICLASSDNLFPALIARLHKPRAHFPLHDIGYAKALAAALIMVATLLQPISPSLRLGISIAMLLLFGDLAMLSYFNTLYLEASTFIFGFASAAFTASLPFWQQRPTWRSLCLPILALVWFACARTQYAPFALGLGAANATVLARHHGNMRAALLVAATCGALTLGLAQQSRNPNSHARSVARANIVDTVLGAVLPAATNQSAALHRLRLPPRCAQLIGRDWYSKGFSADPACSAIYDVPRWRLLPLFAADPATLLLPFGRAIILSRPAYLAYLGHFENATDSASPRFRLLRVTSLSTWLNALPESAYRLLVLASCAGGAAILVMWLPACRRIDCAPLALIGTGGCLTAYALFSSVFGDGYSEVARHGIGLEIGLSLQAAALAPWLLADRPQDLAALRAPAHPC